MTTDDRVVRLAGGYLDEYLGKIRYCLDRLDDDQVWWRPSPGANSIGNLVLHLCGNLTQWLLGGLGGEPDHRQRDLEFSADRTVSRAELGRRLAGVVKRCRALVATLDEKALAARQEVQDSRTDGLGVLVHVVEHMSYHTGQLLYLRKQSLQHGDRLELYPQHRRE